MIYQTFTVLYARLIWNAAWVYSFFRKGNEM